VPEVLTADFAYYRLRKPGYTAPELAALSGKARDLVEAGNDVFLVFKHEESPTSALDAERLLRAEARAA